MFAVLHSDSDHSLPFRSVSSRFHTRDSQGESNVERGDRSTGRVVSLPSLSFPRPRTFAPRENRRPNTETVIDAVPSNVDLATRIYLFIDFSRAIPISIRLVIHPVM